MPLISVCIPAYNRPHELSLLLDSIVRQNYDDCEIVVSDDASPQADKIKEVVDNFIKQYPQARIMYFKNEKNLGYDANIRSLFHKASGDYCLFMGDDDLLASGSLSKIGKVIEESKNIGVILRSWISIDRYTNKVIQTFKYFDSDRFFPSGKRTIITFFRRSIFISGLCINRLAAIQHETDRFDGTLLYQLYLVSNILTKMNGVYVADIVAIRKAGGIVHYFGSSEKERGKYAPGTLLPEHSLNFISGMLGIAKFIDKYQNIEIYKEILNDIGNYSYPLLSIQAEKNIGIYPFLKYGVSLGKMGLWQNKYFMAYFLALLFIKPQLIDKIINIIKKTLGHTPLIGNIYSGRPIKKESDAKFI